MNRAVFTVMIVVLSACHSSQTDADDVPRAVKIASGIRAADLYKICDHGRAIYATDWSGTDIAVVENAPECAK